MQYAALKTLTAVSASAFLLFSSGAHAAYVAQVGGADGNCAFIRSWAWSFPAAGADNLAVNGSNWTVSTTSNALAAGRDLSVSITHVDPATDGTCHPNMEAPSAAHVLNFGPLNSVPGNPGPLQRPNVGTFVKAAASQEGHGAHFDIVKAAVSVPAAGNANLVVSGMHVPTAGTFTASVVNNTGKAITASVTPDYRKADGTLTTGTTITGINVPTNTDKQVALPQSNADLNPLASYIVTATGSPATQTHLAFLGNVDGIYSELDLAAATELFVGPAGFLVPILTNASAPVFAAVDLVQWLANPIMPTLNQSFSISNGTSPDLPGFLFSSTDDITIDTVNGGFTSANALNGVQLAFEGVSIDGHVPEPSTLALLGMATGLLLVSRKSRRSNSIG